MASDLTLDAELPRSKRRRSSAKETATKVAASAAAVDEAAPGAGPTVRRRHLEVFGVAISACALLLLLCLLSYDRSDVLVRGAAARTAQTANLIGPVGAHLADLLLSLLGAASFLLTVTFGGVGLLLFFHRSVSLRLREVLGYLLFVASSAALLQLTFYGRRVLDHLPGGLVGELLGEVSRSMLGTVGASVMGWALLLISVMVVTHVSLSKLVRSALRRVAAWLRSGVGAGRSGLGRVADAWHERRAARAAVELEFDAASDGEGPEGAEAGPISESTPASEEPDPKPRAKRRRGPREPPPTTADTASSGPERDAGPAPAESGTWSFGEEPSGERPRPAPSLEWSLGLEEELPAPRGPRTGCADGGGVAPQEEGWSAGTTPAPAAQGAPEQRGEARPAGRSDADVGAEPDSEEDFDLELDGVEPAAALSPPSESPAAGPRIVDHAAGGRQLSFDEVDAPSQARLRPPASPSGVSWQIPPLSLLDYSARGSHEINRVGLVEMARKLEEKLSNYGVKGEVTEIHPGPVVTMFEFRPAPGIRISKIANLSDDLAMSLEAVRVRIVAPIPGKAVVGIEVPSQSREIVYFKELIADPSFQESKRLLPLCVGKNIIGTPVVQDLAKMPHMLVAGATGSGKSVLVNAFVLSLLYRYSPEDLRMIMVDPKQLEFSMYEGIPHLLLPVVTDPKKAAAALRWAVAEMDRRYTLMREARVRKLPDYNKWVARQQAEYDRRSAELSGRSIRLDDPDDDLDDDALPEPPEKLPFLVIFIDEFAELMMVASKDVEISVARLAQKARAAGIHLILATQRPSVDVITGVIKANFPARIGLQVAQREDSRTILGQNGAENLLGDGDMLAMTPGSSGLTRAHGALVTDGEIQRVCEHWKDQGRPSYKMDILTEDESSGKKGEDEIEDDLYDNAVFVVAEARMASASMLQRRLRIGYNRAARLIEVMEREGVVGPPDGARPREVLVPPPVEI